MRDELVGGCLRDEHGQDDEATAAETWSVDYLGAGGALDAQAAAETNEKALDSLLAHGVVEDMRREDANNFKFLTSLGVED